MTTAPILRYFEFSHLPRGILRDTSEEFRVLAIKVDNSLPDGPEKSTSLRKLLEAKDAAVRAALDVDTD